MHTVPERLKKLRTENEYTQEYIAAQMHIARSTYANWETGMFSPDLDKILWLCNFYNVSADYLLGRTETPTDKEATLLCVAENIPESSSNTNEHNKLLNYYNRLDEENQDYIRGMMIQLYKEQSSENENKKSSNIG